MATTTVSLDNIDVALQRDAEKIFADLGMTPSDVYQRILRRTVEEQHFPIDLFSPNAETLEAMAELDRGEGKSFNTVAELMADLDADD
jgi:DNA-damage-inducible protein J